jgi:hypothetical protein
MQSKLTGISVLLQRCANPSNQKQPFGTTLPRLGSRVRIPSPAPITAFPGPERRAMDRPYRPDLAVEEWKSFRSAFSAAEIDEVEGVDRGVPLGLRPLQ